MKQAEREEMLARLRQLADRRVNDAVKLAFLNEETADQVDGLDLSGLLEVKRSDKGFEAKFVDQIKVLEMMRQLSEESGAEAAQAFFQALDGPAEGAEG